MLQHQWTFNIASLAGKRQQRLYVRYRQIRVFRRQQQINYTFHALIRASVTTAHLHHMEQTGSRFTPHPLLPHGNACYYSQIILNSLPLLLFLELFWHNYLRPTESVPTLSLHFLSTIYYTLPMVCVPHCPFCWGVLQLQFNSIMNAGMVDVT